ncbi:alpha/beta hydrolase [Rhizobium sp. 16-449-1b]|nr:alpha/beta hydrolase [Rhizobium sp. 16-449-1b]
MVDAATAAHLPLLESQEPQVARANYAARRRADQPALQPVASVRDIEIDGPSSKIGLRVIRGVDGDEILSCLVYFHGGGWMLGSPESHEGICRTLASASRCCVVSVDYRLAPENPFPAAVEDAVAAFQWVFSHADELMIDANTLAVGGDSAGGNLATILALMGRDGDLPKSVYQLLFYPAVDLRLGTSTFASAAEGMLVTASTIRWFVDHYIPDVEERSHWHASPILAESLEGLPPAFVLTCGLDPLGEEGRQYANRLEEEGVPVTTLNLPDQAHGFLNLGKAIGAAQGVLLYAAFMLSEEWRHVHKRGESTVTT